MVADYLATYDGATLPAGSLTHAVRFGLVLHADRVERRRAWYTLEAFNASTKGLDVTEWIKALALNDEDAEKAAQTLQANTSFLEGMRG